MGGGCGGGGGGGGLLFFSHTFDVCCFLFPLPAARNDNAFILAALSRDCFQLIFVVRGLCSRNPLSRTTLENARRGYEGFSKDLAHLFFLFHSLFYENK